MRLIGEAMQTVPVETKRNRGIEMVRSAVHTWVSIGILVALATGCAHRQDYFGHASEGLENPVVVMFALKGQAPAGTPVVFPVSESVYAQISSRGRAHANKLGSNLWVQALENNQEYVVGWRLTTGRMFGYESDPFVAKEGMSVAVAPGMPASFEYNLRSVSRGLWPRNVLLTKEFADGNNTNSLIKESSRQKVGKSGVIRFENLPGGTYQIRAVREDGMKTDYPDPFLNDWRRIEIVSGAENRIEADPPFVDTSAEPGDGSVTGKLLDASGNPMSGRAIYLLAICEDSRGADSPSDAAFVRPDLPSSYYFYPKQITDGNGRFEFEGVNPYYAYQIEYRELGSNACGAYHGFAGSQFNEGIPLEVSLVAH